MVFRVSAADVESADDFLTPFVSKCTRFGSDIVHSSLIKSMHSFLLHSFAGSNMEFLGYIYYAISVQYLRSLYYFFSLLFAN